MEVIECRDNSTTGPQRFRLELLSDNGPSRFQQRDAFLYGHPVPTLVRQVSALDWRNRNVPYFKYEGREGRISESVVVVNRELAERLVAGYKFPLVCGSEGDDRTHFQVRDDEPIESELKLCVHRVRID
jgi:hypothetical protein